MFLVLPIAPANLLIFNIRLSMENEASTRK